MRDLDSLTPAEIKATIRKLAPELGNFASYTVIHQIASDLGSSTSTTERSYRWNSIFDRYCGRVNRALNALAEDGELVKISGGGRNSVSYRTPEKHRELEAEAEARAENKRQVDHAWAQVEHELAGLGFFFETTTRGKLSLGSWQELIAQWKQERSS